MTTTTMTPPADRPAASKPAGSKPVPACQDHKHVDPDVFHPTPGDTVALATARACCARCPVRRACLRCALDHDVDGVWAGTTPDERRALQRAHTLPALPVGAVGAGAQLRTALPGPHLLDGHLDRHADRRSTGRSEIHTTDLDGMAS